MKQWSLSVVLLAAVISSACSAPGPSRAPASDEPLRAAWRNAPTGQSIAWSEQWWEQFSSNRLNGLVVSALGDNPGLSAVRERLAAARLIEGAGAVEYRPASGLQTGSERTPGARANYFQAGVSGHWELPLFGRGRNAERILQSQTLDAEADLAAARSSLVAETVCAWLDGYFASREMSRSEALLQLADARQQRVAARVQVGLDDRDASLASQQISRDAATALAHEARIRAQSLERLAALLGRADPDEAWIAAEDPAVAMPAVPASVPPDLLRRRSDIRRAEAAIERAAAREGIARAEFYPHISIDGSLTAALPLAGATSGGISSILSVGPVITLPLFDWGLLRARRDADGAELRAATFDYRQTVLDAVADAELAFAQLNEATSKVKSTAASAAALQVVSERAATQRRLGLLDQVAALDQERQSLLLLQSLDDARLQEGQAAAHLYAVLGPGPGRRNRTSDQW